MDFVFTFCDDAAGETVPGLAGAANTAHWGIEDPAAVEERTFESSGFVGGALHQESDFRL